LIEIAPHLAVIGVGGNIGTDDEIIDRFRRARDAFREYGHVWSASLYRTAPLGPSQSDFLNTALMVRLDDGTPDELISVVLEIELLLGRDRRSEERWGPRKIDLDILVWGARVIRTPSVEIPHPRLLDRRFALEPLSELLGPHPMPGTAMRIYQCLDEVRDQKLELVIREW
jgi:2-amino-4-hydroxy-6-hydroxymethyldihydropteridine diphosphokinase